MQTLYLYNFSYASNILVMYACFYLSGNAFFLAMYVLHFAMHVNYLVS